VKENKRVPETEKEAFIYAFCATEPHKIDWTISMEKVKIDAITPSSV